MIERSGYHSVSIRIVKADTVDDVLVTDKSLQILARVGVPKFAGLIIRASNELSSVLVEVTIGQGLLMGDQFLLELKILNVLASHFYQKPINELHQVVSLGDRNEVFLLENLVHQLLDVGVLVEVEEVDGLALPVSAGSRVLQNDSWGVIPEKEFLEFHSGKNYKI